MTDFTTATRTLFDGDRVVAQHVRMYRLVIRSEGRPAITREIGRPRTRIGSRRGNDVVLDDKAVSRIHLEIAADDDGFRLRDLGSRNGTYVDGYKSADRYLHPGALIRVGRTELSFEPLEREAEVPVAETDRFGPLLGRSLAMREVFATLERIAPTDFTVLIEGETGTGKEVVARTIHEASRRSAAPQAVFDAAAVPAQLIESQLFGHCRGAFTGATSARPGLFAEADGGTLLLDEMGELPLDLQPRLLRVLEQREVTPVGSHEARPVDVRVVAATHRDLAAAVNAGTFRDDLYYRLAVVRLVVPPLRDRVEDIPLLVDSFVRRSLPKDAARADRLVASVPETSWSRLRSHPWPGNVRQLRNVVEASLAFAEDDRLDIDPTASGARARHSTSPPRAEADLQRPFAQQRDELLARFERSYLLGILDDNDGNVTRAAEQAGLDRAYFRRLLRKYRDSS